MKQKVSKVNTFLAVTAIVAIFIAIFALSRSCSNTQHISPEDYAESIRNLNDTINGLKNDIARYKAEIERIDLERERIRKELEQIIRDNEKIDTELANGSWDDNIRFLSEYLSKKDTLGERHNRGH